MKLYLTVIGAAMAIIAAINILLHTAQWYEIILLVTLCTALQFALDGLIAIIINKLPDRLFGVENPLFYISEAGKKLYKKLNTLSMQCHGEPFGFWKNIKFFGFV